MPTRGTVVNPRLHALLVDWIDWYVARSGYAPTVRELAEYGGMSVSTAHHHLLSMRADGLVDWVPGDARTLHTVPRPAENTVA